MTLFQKGAETRNWTATRKAAVKRRRLQTAAMMDKHFGLQFV